MGKLFSLLLFILCAGIPATTTAGPSVNSVAGNYIGTEEQGVIQFFGIPYAQAPVGPLRWRAPVSLPRLRDDFNATQYGPACPQPEWKLNRGLPQSEDCLTLNIWTPASTSANGLPVMVWIHGGSFKGGSNRWWVAEGDHLASHGVVVVSINYRLGLLGRFAHPALTAEQGEQTIANFGLADQVQALKWVTENIAAFGGDPNNVTIFGYSAGAVSVNFLAAMPSARGLFDNVISQSSAVSLPHTRQMLKGLPGRPSLESEGVAAMTAIGIPAQASADDLRALSVEHLLSYALPPGSMNPVVDGTVVTEDLSASYRRGDLNASAFIIGVDSWEASLAKGMHAMPGPAYQGLLTKAHGFTPEQISSTYGDNRDPYAVGDELFADGFHASSLWLARQAQQSGRNTYLYWFEYLPPDADLLPGVPHGGEVPYVFGNLEHRERVGNPPVTTADRVFSNQVQEFWVSFAREGRPSAHGIEPWTSIANKNNWMALGEVSGMRPNLLMERMAFWMQHYE